MIRKNTRGAAWLVAACLMQASTAAADILIFDSGEDTAPYSFLPNLPRFNNASLYAFQAISDTGGNHDFESYIRFPLSVGDIPAGQVVTEALLVVTYAFDFTSFGETSSEPGVLDCREVAGPWDQTTLNWTNRPPVDAPFDTITQIVSFGALICDATPVVQGWLYGEMPNNGFALTSPTARVMGMNSFESSVDPSLMPNLILTTEVPEPGFAAALLLGIGSLVRARRSRPPGRAMETEPEIGGA